MTPYQTEAHLIFEGKALYLTQLPSEWYRKRSEKDLIAVIKSALSRGERNSAAAMVLELLDFPQTWEDVAFEERAYREDFGDLGGVDAELRDLVRQVFPAILLPANAYLFDCYKAILRGTLQDPLWNRLLSGSC